MDGSSSEHPIDFNLLEDIEVPSLPQSQPEVARTSIVLQDAINGALRVVIPHLLSLLNAIGLYTFRGRLVEIPIIEGIHSVREITRDRLERIFIDNLDLYVQPHGSKQRPFSVRNVAAWNTIDPSKEFAHLAKPLDQIVHHPVLSPSEQRMLTVGYISSLRIYSSYLPLSESEESWLLKANRDDAIQALAYIRQYFVDFNFVEESDFANLISVLLSGVSGIAYTKLVPFLAISGDQFGAGKTLLGQVLSVILSGKEAAVLEYPKDGAQAARILEAESLNPDTFSLFDNLASTLVGERLAAIATSRRIKGRKLHSHDSFEAVRKPFIVFTGNEVQVADDLIRRTLPVRIRSRAISESGYKFPDPLRALIANRHQILLSLLVIAAAWRNLGSTPGSFRLKSFEVFSESVSGMLELIGVAGFGSNIGMLHKPSLRALHDIQQLLYLSQHVKWGSQFSVADLAARKSIGGSLSLSAQLPEFAQLLSSLGNRTNAQSLGIFLRKMSQRTTPFQQDIIVCKIEAKSESNTAIYSLRPHGWSNGEPTEEELRSFKEYIEEKVRETKEGANSITT